MVHYITNHSLILCLFPYTFGIQLSQDSKLRIKSNSPVTLYFYYENKYVLFFILLSMIYNTLVYARGGILWILGFYGAVASIIINNI